MSRYFQSSYHGSNDYHKYRQEKLGIKNSVTQGYSYPQNTTLKSSINDKYYDRNYLAHQAPSNKSNLNFTQQVTNKNQRYSSKYKDYQGMKADCNEKYSTNYDYVPEKKESKINNYLSDKYANQSTKYISQNESNQQFANTYRKRSNSAFRDYQINQRTPVIQNFQDLIISRKRNYEYLNNATNNQPYQSAKIHHYENKIHNLYQNSNQPKILQTNNLSSKRSNLGHSTSTAIKYINEQNFQQKRNLSPYQNRNQIIKQKLNLSSNHHQPLNSFNSKTNLNIQSQQEIRSKNQQYTSRYTSNLVTPQKPQQSVKTDRDLSEQRRKSLIQKSQLLKQKLNKLNVSSNKVTENQDYSKNKDKQNINIQKYTPTKRYQSYFVQKNTQKNTQNDQKVPVKLDFDIKTKNKQTGIIYQSILKESNQNSSNINRDYLQEPGKSQSSFVPNSTSNKNFTERTQSSDAALKKINELNQRINSRLQSILKNYS